MSEAEGRPARRSEAFWGRRYGKGLRPGLSEALAEVLPRFRLDLEAPAPADLGNLFASPVEGVRLEIGFGGGEHLAYEAGRFPGIGFIGVEPFVNGMAKLAARLSEAPPANLRLWDDDAAALLDWLPPASLEQIDLLYPDPWPKKRHWKRRFVSRRNVDRFARVLKRGGLFRFASDIAGYVNWTLSHIRAHPDFEWTARSADDWRKPFEGWPSTRYEAKALRDGRTPAYLAFRRT